MDVLTTTLPHHFEQSVDLNATAAAVFAHLDNFERFGSHMMRSSWMMAGSHMRYEFDAARGQRIGARVRLLGSVMGLPLEIEEQVLERTPPLSKAWNTVGHARMLVIEAYRMGFEVQPRGAVCRLRVYVDYAIPRSGLRHLLGRIAGHRYARWCVDATIAGATQQFGEAA